MDTRLSAQVPSAVFDETADAELDARKSYQDVSSTIQNRVSVGRSAMVLVVRVGLAVRRASHSCRLPIALFLTSS